MSRTQSAVPEAEALVTSWREVEVGEAAAGQPKWCGFLHCSRGGPGMGTRGVKALGLIWTSLSLNVNL